MLNIADFVLFGIVALFAVIGSTRGLAKSLFGLGSIILSLVLAFFLYPIVSDVLTQSPAGEFVTEKVEQIFGQNDSISEVQKEDGTEKNNINLPNMIQDAAQEAGKQVQKSVSAGVSAAALNIISMLIVFLLVRLLLWILSKALDVATKLPVIHGCNKLFGGIFGAVSSLLVVYLLLGLLAFTTLLNTTEDLGRTVQSSLLVSQMYENNILLYFLHIQ